MIIWTQGSRSTPLPREAKVNKESRDLLVVLFPKAMAREARKWMSADSLIGCVAHL